MPAYPANAIDYGEIVTESLRIMSSIRAMCAQMQTDSFDAPVTIERLNSFVRTLKERRSRMTELEARVQPGDYPALRTWATANLRLPDGTAYAGDYVADYTDARNAVVAFLAWLQGQFPRTHSIAWQDADPVNVISPTPWPSNGPEANALRNQLQLVLGAIAA
jgi:hypothetical protein